MKLWKTWLFFLLVLGAAAGAILALGTGAHIRSASPTPAVAYITREKGARAQAANPLSRAQTAARMSCMLGRWDNGVAPAHTPPAPSHPRSHWKGESL